MYPSSLRICIICLQIFVTFPLMEEKHCSPFRLKEIKGVAGGMGITGIKLAGITNGANTYHTKMQHIDTKCATMTLALGLQMEPILAQHEPKKVRGVAAD